MTSDIHVIVCGFKSLEQAEEWASWYQGQGEQNWQSWRECREDEGIDVHSGLVQQIFVIEPNVVKILLK